MTRTQTMVQLNEDLVAELDKEAAQRKVSRSHLIREVLDGFLVSRRSAEAIRSYTEGYKRAPQSTPDEWGELDISSDRAEYELGCRLDAEEEAQGLEW